RLVAWSTLNGTEIGPPIKLAGTESILMKALSRDGGRVAIALQPPRSDGDGRPNTPTSIRVFDLRGSRQTVDVQIGRLLPATLIFNHDATRLAVAAGLPMIPPGSKVAPHDELLVFDPKNGRAIGVPIVVDFRVERIQYSNDNQRL